MWDKDEDKDEIESPSSSDPDTPESANASRKRRYSSCSDEDDERGFFDARKRRKDVDVTKVPETYSEALEQNEELRREINMLLALIGQTDIAPDAPSSVRDLLEGAIKIGESISRRIQEAYDSKSALTYNARKTGVTSDDLSKAMLPFIPEIEKLSRTNNLDCLEVANNLVHRLRACSYGDLEEGSGYGDRPSDGPADELLQDIIRRRLAAGETWNMAQDLIELDESAEGVAEYGIEPFYPKSRELLRSVVPPEALQEEEEKSVPPTPQVPEEKQLPWPFLYRYQFSPRRPSPAVTYGHCWLPPRYRL